MATKRNASIDDIARARAAASSVGCTSDGTLRIKGAGGTWTSFQGWEYVESYQGITRIISPQQDVYEIRADGAYNHVRRA